MTPAFSVLMAAYNSASTIGQALDSLLAQTRGDWEAIVVDDGSCDRTAAIAREYAERDPRITVISKANGGTASARNLATKHASGGLMSLLDADDAYLPEYFERMARFVEAHPSYGIYSSDGFVFSEGESPRPDDLQPDCEVRSYRAEDLLVRNRIRVLTMFRREVYDLVGGFDEDRRQAIEDWDFWLRALLLGVGHIHNPEPLWLYRVSAGQKTGDPLSAARGDAFLFEKLLASGSLAGSRRRIALAKQRGIARYIRVLEARQRRYTLERRLADGDFTGARAAYWDARRGYTNVLMRFAGLIVVLISPRLFAKVLVTRGAQPL